MREREPDAASAPGASWEFDVIEFTRSMGKVKL